MLDWNTNIPIFSPIIGPLPKGYIYHTCFRLKGGETREEAATLPFLGFFSLGLVFLGFLVFT